MKVSREGVTGRQRGKEKSIFILSLTRLQQQHICSLKPVTYVAFTAVPNNSLGVD